MSGATLISVHADGGVTPAGLMAASVAQQRIFDGPELAQGVAAFFDKREVVFG